MLRVLLESVVATGTFLGLYGGADAVRGFFCLRRRRSPERNYYDF